MTAYHITSSSEGAMETQEAGRWEGVSHMLLGDIANISKDQLLLLFNDSEHNNMSGQYTVLYGHFI